DKAPLEHSPLGVMPTAKSAIVCAVHLPDACIELGSEPDVRIPGPAKVISNVAYTLNFIAYRLALVLQECGFNAIPLAQSVYWNYRPDRGAKRGWMGDICHYYAAVAAGLGEIGWHNLCITPEFGTRQRFVTIITDAQLTADPLYSGEPLCDKCLLCAKNCPTRSFDKEVSGMLQIEIEDKKYSFPNRNLWRCGIGENFGLDVLMPWPEKIDEKIILERTEEATRNPGMLYGWKMGNCIKACVPKKKRFWDKKYCTLPRSRKPMTPAAGAEQLEIVKNELLNLAYTNDADRVLFFSKTDLEKSGILPAYFLPDAQSLILAGFNNMPDFNDIGSRVELLIANKIEKYGHSALIVSGLKPQKIIKTFNLTDSGMVWKVIITSLPFPTSAVPSAIFTIPSRQLSSAAVKTALQAIAFEGGVRLFGVSSSERIANIASQLEKILTADNEKYFEVDRHTWKFNADISVEQYGYKPYPANPVLSKNKRIVKNAENYLANARSIIAIGIPFPRASVEWAGKGEGKKVGHFSISLHVTVFQLLSEALYKMSNYLNQFGYKTAYTFDLNGLAGQVIAGKYQPDLSGNSFTALAAGLGDLGWSGNLLTKEYGGNQRIAALITDAVLDEDAVYHGPPLCKKCFKCADQCPVKAISKEITYKIEIDNKIFNWGKRDQLRCDWAQKYGLVGEAGPEMIGSQTDLPLPSEITPETVCTALCKLDRIQSRPYYTSIVEHCLINCPVSDNNI
ncbi:MAG TPA: hypothetical protein DC049_02595, partial [Spirochaetia bacterium]|nr:hypothetical protein [Spirochaetia bacterium]